MAIHKHLQSAERCKWHENDEWMWTLIFNHITNGENVYSPTGGRFHPFGNSNSDKRATVHFDRSRFPKKWKAFSIESVKRTKVRLFTVHIPTNIVVHSQSVIVLWTGRSAINHGQQSTAWETSIIDSVVWWISKVIQMNFKVKYSLKWESVIVSDI
jgi:hypothetical protein